MTLASEKTKKGKGYRESFLAEHAYIPCLFLLIAQDKTEDCSVVIAQETFKKLPPGEGEGEGR